LATTIDHVGSATAVFVGAPELLSQLNNSQLASDIDHVDLATLRTLTRQTLDGVSTLIISLYGEQPGIMRHQDAADLRESATQTLDLLTRIAALPAKPQIILLTTTGTPLDICVSAVRQGVQHFIDVEQTDWVSRVEKLLSQAPAGTQARVMQSPKAMLEAVGIMAISPAMQELMTQVYRGAQVSDATVLIHGESGTGKQLLAEAIHRLDPKRAKFNFIPVNCAAITGTLAESELFGHVKGAFSGATENRLGYFRSANRGTIFLDEISELPAHLQPKLLRVLQERRVLPVGADREEPIDVRVVAATNVSLQEKVARGEFRLDLYQRLNVVHLAVPPLRQRMEDIPILVEHFVKKYQHYCSAPIRDIDPRVFELLRRKLGNGNVRELENVVRQTLVFKAKGDRIELSDLPRYLFEGEDAQPQRELIPTDIADNLVSLIRTKRISLKQAVDTFEKVLINHAAKASPEMTKVQLAKVLGLPRRTLYYKMDLPEPKE